LATLDKKEPEEIEAHLHHQQAKRKRSGKRPRSRRPTMPNSQQSCSASCDRALPS
jgi:hypothetical protein